MEHHKTVDKIRKILDENECWYEYFEHEPVRTSEEAAQVRPDYTLKQGAKALIIKIKNKMHPNSLVANSKYVMLVIPGDKKFDKRKVKQVLETGDMTFASEEEVATITGGVQVGGVPPWGNLWGLPVIADGGVFADEKMIFNAGDRRVSVAMRTGDYKRLVNPKIGDLTSEPLGADGVGMETQRN